MVVKEPGGRRTEERRVYVQNGDDAVTTAVSIGALVLLAALVILMFLNYDSLRNWTQQTVPQTEIQVPNSTVTPVPTAVPTPVPVPYPVPGQNTVTEKVVPVPTLMPPAQTPSQTNEPPPSHFGDGNMTTPVPSTAPSTTPSSSQSSSSDSTSTSTSTGTDNSGSSAGQ